MWINKLDVELKEVFNLAKLIAIIPSTQRERKHNFQH